MGASACAAMITGMALCSTPFEHRINRLARLYRMSKVICKYAAMRSLDPVMVLAVAKHESNMTPWLRGATGDYGLMQIHSPSRMAQKRFGLRKCDLLKLECNVNHGTKLMKVIRDSCLSSHTHRSKNFHWMRHYNWYGGNGKYHLKILWLTKAYKRAWTEKNNKLFKMITRRRFPRNLADVAK